MIDGAQYTDTVDLADAVHLNDTGASKLAQGIITAIIDSGVTPVTNTGSVARHRKWVVQSSSSMIQLISVSPVTVSVFRINGCQLEKFRNVTSLWFGNHYPAGVYFVRISDGTRRQVFPVIKK